jgi:exonuclease SbcC
MKLKKIKLRNIRSYENQEIEFPEKSLLLAGDIGSGKTSILMAVEYALFGLQPGQKGSALLRNGSNFGEVSLEFEVGGQNIIIERKLKRESKSVSNDYSAIAINGEKTELSVTELKTKILGLLRYPPEFIKKNNLLYRYTVYTPQENMKQIILEDPETRLNMLGYVFGIDKYKKIRENVSILTTKLKEESKLLQGEIKSLDGDKLQIEAKKQSIVALQSQIEAKKCEREEKSKKRKLIEAEAAELESRIKEKENFEKEVEKTRIHIISKKENLSILLREFDSIAKTLSEASESFDEKALENIKEKIFAKRGEIEKINSSFIEISTKIKSLERDKALVLEKKNRVFQIEVCPTCLQNVPHAHKHNILLETEKNLAEILNNISVLEKELAETKIALENSRAEIPKIEEEKTRLEIFRTKAMYAEKSKIRIEEIRKSREALEKDITFLSAHMDSLKESILQFSKYNNLHRIKQEELELARHDEKKTEISLAEFNKEIEITNNSILELQKSIESKEEAKKRLSEILEINDWLSSQFLSLVNFIERNVMIKLRAEFAGLFSKWFHMLAGEGFEVQLDENFTPIILQGETEMDYSFLSGGERTSIALAYRLALNQTINSVLSNIETRDIIILDEPTDGFSEFQLDKMRDVLAELNAAQLIVVSHEQKIEGFVDNIIKLKKDGSFSSLLDPPSFPKIN